MNLIMSNKVSLEDFFKENPRKEAMYGIYDGTKFVEMWTGFLSDKGEATHWSSNNPLESSIIWEKIKKHKKPPIGLMTRDLYEESKNKERLGDVSGAILRYLQDNKPINIEWIEEYNELVGKEIK